MNSRSIVAMSNLLKKTPSLTMNLKQKRSSSILHALSTNVQASSSELAGSSPAEFDLKKISRSHLSSAALPRHQTSDDELVVTCRPCAAHDRDHMIEFMRKMFVSKEPLMRSLGATPENSKKYVSYCIDEALDQNVSFLALDGISGEICGLRLNAIGPSNGKELSLDFGQKVNAVPKFLHFIEDGLAELLGTDRFLRHVAICVKQSASQCGIATDLMKLSVDRALDKNLLFMVAMCSWKLPYKLACKMGYQLARDLAYVDYATTQSHLSLEQQKSMLDLALNQEKARVMVKQLNQ